MLVEYQNLFLYASFVLEIWHTFYQHRNDFMPKFSHVAKEQFFIPWEDVNVGSSEIFLTTTHVGRLQISFFCGSFRLEIFHICNQHIDGLMKKNSYEKKIQSLGGCQSWQ